MTDRKLGIVCVSFRVPERRLADHFAWNAQRYEDSLACVFVVTDRQYDVPRYAECVVFPENQLPVRDGKPRFSLTRTKNAGLRAAIAAGCEVIICTDVDIAFESPAWEVALCVTNKVAAVPVYRMSHAAAWERRAEAYDIAPLATGTIVMTAMNWQRVPYCEEQWGYGCDDGLLLERIRAARPVIQIDRMGYVYHMAHVDGTPQREFDSENPRTDHWNRDNGLNPENFAHNARFHCRKPRRLI